MAEPRNEQLFALLIAIWGGVFTWSIIGFVTGEPTGDGFTRGLNRITGLLLVTYDVDGFYYLARAALVKDERHLDRFDQAFAHVFGGSNRSRPRMCDRCDRDARGMAAKLAEKHLTRRSGAESRLGGFDKLMETLRSGWRNRRAGTRAARNGSAPPAPRPSAPMATTPRACASASTKAAIAAP
jgi:uncharacterized protein with von Willebrand factor type A (vWA) domain